jgi:hypothetical protein
VAGASGAAAVGTVAGKRTAIVASGANFPDALAGGPLSYASALPTLLTEPSFLPAPTKAALDSLDIDLVQLLGGNSAVSRAVEDEITAMGIQVSRIAGTDRTDTAARVATFAQSQLGFGKTHVNLARGDAFADALTGGPHAGQEKAPVLLTATSTALGAATRTWLSDRKADLANGHIFGGEGAVSSQVQNEAEAAAGAPRDLFTVSPQASQTNVASTSATTNEGARDCSAAVASGTPSVTVALFPSGNVTKDSSGTKFVDADRNGIADFTRKTTGAVIERINGAENPENPDSNEVKSVPAQGGQVTFTIDSTSTDDVTAVVYQDQTGDGLNVDQTGVPTEPFGTGCRTNFIPPEAAAGSRGTTVRLVNRVENYFVGGSTATTANPNSGSGDFTYFYDDNDLFRFGGNPITFAQFEGILSTADVADVTYNPDPSGVSTFNVTEDRVDPASNVTAEAVDADKDGKQDEVLVSFILPNTNGAGTRYELLRAFTRTGGTVSNDQVCGTPDDSAGTYQTVTVVTSSPYTDNSQLDDQVAPEPDCYRYRIRAVNDVSGAFANSNDSPTVRIPGDDVAALRSLDVRHADVGIVGSGNLEPGDETQICFNDEVALFNNGDAIRIADGNSVGDVVNGQNAAFTRGDQPTPGSQTPPRILCPGFDTERDRVLVISHTGNPNPVSGTPTFSIPSNIISHVGVTDDVGNGWDIPGSTDTQIDIEA